MGILANTPVEVPSRRLSFDGVYIKSLRVIFSELTATPVVKAAELIFRELFRLAPVVVAVRRLQLLVFFLIITPITFPLMSEISLKLSLSTIALTTNSLKLQTLAIARGGGSIEYLAFLLAGTGVALSPGQHLQLINSRSLSIRFVHGGFCAGAKYFSMLLTLFTLLCCMCTSSAFSYLILICWCCCFLRLIRCFSVCWCLTSLLRMVWVGWYLDGSWLRALGVETIGFLVGVLVLAKSAMNVNDSVWRVRVGCLVTIGLASHLNRFIDCFFGFLAGVCCCCCVWIAFILISEIRRK